MSEASPRFRQDLTVAPTEADGVACVDVSDPKTGANFRFYDFEYQLALQLNGQPVAQVTDWASKTYGADLTVDGIPEFATRLGELGFLDMGTLGGSPSPPATGSVEQSSPSPTRSSAPSDSAGPRAPLPATAVRAGNGGVSPAAPAPAEPAPALDDASDGVAAEWESAQAAKTAQFVPDLAMLDSAPEPTPVVPLDILKLTSESSSAPLPEGAPTAIHGEVTAQAIMELPSEALDSQPVSAPPVTVAPDGAPKPVAARSSWATDLDGALQSSASPPAVRPPPAPTLEGALPTLPVQV